MRLFVQVLHSSGAQRDGVHSIGQFIGGMKCNEQPEQWGWRCFLFFWCLPARPPHRCPHPCRVPTLRKSPAPAPPPTCPSIRLRQVGQLESSKSGMYTLAPLRNKTEGATPRENLSTHAILVCKCLRCPLLWSSNHSGHHAMASRLQLPHLLSTLVAISAVNITQ